MASTPQPGMTPPAPGQHKEEPDLWQEDDIPSQDKPDKPGASEEQREREPEPGKRDD